MAAVLPVEFRSLSSAVPKLQLNDLPNEVLSTILMRVPVQDLLNCRLVSGRWKTLSTTTCQRRYVHLKCRTSSIQSLTFTQDIMKSFYSTFKHDQELPWSYATFHISRHKEDFTKLGYYINIKKEKEFCRRFGNRLKKLHLGGFQVPALMDVIKLTPNVEEIISRIRSEGDEQWKLFQNYGNINPLRMLRHLEIVVRAPCTLKILQLIISNAGPRLTYIRLTIENDGSKFANQIAPLLVNIPNISLFCYFVETMEMFDVFAERSLAVRDLEMKFKPCVVFLEYYYPLQAFLVNISKVLMKLKLGFWMRMGQSLDKPPECTLEIPFLPVLKCLTINNYTGDYLAPFVKNQFPILKTVHLDFLGSQTELFNNATFDSVTELDVVRTIRPEGFWKKVFPNYKIFGSDADPSTYN